MAPVIVIVIAVSIFAGASAVFLSMRPSPISAMAFGIVFSCTAIVYLLAIPLIARGTC